VTSTSCFTHIRFLRQIHQFLQPVNRLFAFKCNWRSERH